MNTSQLRWTARSLMILAVLLGLTAIVGAAWTARGAQLVQRIEPNSAAGASLFGDADQGTPIGSPQVLIVRDKAAFLPGAGPNGSRLVNERYLRERGLYPLQAKTVWFIRDMALLSSLALLTAGGALWWWAGRRTALRAE